MWHKGVHSILVETDIVSIKGGRDLHLLGTEAILFTAAIYCELVIIIRLSNHMKRAVI